MAELTTLELEQLHQNCAEIADLADGLKEILTELVENSANVKMTAIVRLALDRITRLSEEYV